MGGDSFSLVIDRTCIFLGWVLGQISLTQPFVDFSTHSITWFVKWIGL